MAIIITRPGAKAKRLERAEVTEEKTLQAYIAENPECLPIDQIQDDLKLLILDREFSTNAGSIDALGVDQEGEVYIIETKLSKNPDKRRVVAQVLDYGASLWRTYRRGHEFRSRLESLTEAKRKKSLQQQIQDFFELEPEEAGQLPDTIGENVVEGRFRFLVLMDHIDDRLKDLITFVNTNSQFTVFGVELEFYRLDDSTIAIPRLHGITQKAPSPDARDPEEAFFKQAESSLGPEPLAAVKDLFEFSKLEADIVSWGRGAKGSFNPKFGSISAKSLYTMWSNGRLCINFKWLYRSEAGQKAADLLRKKLLAAGFPIPEDYPDHFVGLNPSLWVSRSEKLKAIIREVISATKDTPQ